MAEKKTEDIFKSYLNGKPAYDDHFHSKTSVRRNCIELEKSGANMSSVERQRERERETERERERGR